MNWRFRVVERSRGMFWIYKRPAWWPFWMYAWDGCIYETLERALAEIEDYKRQISFRPIVHL